ncbi:Tyrosyl-DNA phosphodiesterase 2 [Physocladia obscura]|uniref:Tyrosyl-DNA phosphodiesterase 2 n=1 Tax=Physocladia obscura TaxID=109957 RepID=A0AAD5T1C9_9FUNG|nr:Tyrosyl-DNA phosphodiesterase 2 [Physocladia obscura]
MQQQLQKTLTTLKSTPMRVRANNGTVMEYTAGKATTETLSEAKALNFTTSTTISSTAFITAPKPSGVIFRAGEWIKYEPLTNPPEADSNQPQTMTLRLVTWNVWFETEHISARSRALLAEALATNPSILCFQEVTQPFMSILEETEQIRNNFWLSYDPKTHNFAQGGYTCIVAVNLSYFTIKLLKEVEVYSIMGRSLWLVELSYVVNSLIKTLRVMTSHFESMSYGQHARRDQRIAAKQALLAELNFGISAAYDFILCGDFNMTEDAEENSLLELGFHDVFDTVPNSTTTNSKFRRETVVPGGYTIGITYPSDIFPPKRFDRVVMLPPVVVEDNDKNPLIPVEYFELGKSPILGLSSSNGLNNCVYPSDHLGVCVSFKM